MFKNKETGEKGYLRANREICPEIEDENGIVIKVYDTITELLGEWEEYKEPKKYWYITGEGDAIKDRVDGEWAEYRKSIGNHFETEEETEKAVEKLKAWERLRNKGFKFGGWTRTSKGLGGSAILEITAKVNDFVIYDDLNLLFGGEE